MHDGVIVAGGMFTNAGGVSANFIAKWDGTAWASMNKGMSSYVCALAVFDGELIAGGYFLRAGGANVSCIAKWNGEGWEPLGEGMDDGSVHSLVVYNRELYAGGRFTNAGGVYAFTAAGGVYAGHIAKWNGTTWSPVGQGLDHWVFFLLVFDNELIVCGEFDTAGGVRASKIAKWDGTNWFPLDRGLAEPVHALSIDKGKLVAEGYECKLTWDGTRWKRGKSVCNSLTG